MAARYWVGGSGTWDATNTANWSTTSGGAGGASVPTSVDAPVFNSLSGGGTVTLDYTPTIVNIDFRGFAGTFDFTTYEINANRNGGVIVQQDSTSTMAGTRTINLTYAGAVGTRTLGMTGVSESNALNIKVIAGTDIISHNTNNSFNNLDFTGFAGTLNVQTRTIFGNLVFSAGMTVNAGTQATTFSKTSGTQTITTNGKTFDFPITVNGVGGTVEFVDALTQGSTRTFTITNGTVKLKAGATSTVGAFTTSGTSQKFLESTLTGSQATLSQASGTISASYLTIKDINATGGATWQAFTTNNNVDAGNNLGWDFSFQTGKYIYTVRKNKRILP